MSQLFRRAWKVQVDTLDISNLDIEFKILRNVKSVPNKCAITVWNLNKDHRSQLIKRNRPNPDSKKLVGIPVQVEAGYVDNTSVLFRGDLREVGSARDGSNWKTVIAGDDGGRAYREARISKNFKKDTPVSKILKACTEALGVGLGNSKQFLAEAKFIGIGATIPSPQTFSGRASDALDVACGTIGLTWSIQNGALQLQFKGQPIDTPAVLLTPETGLIGSPEASVDATVSLGNAQQFAADAKKKIAKQPKPKDPGIIKLKALIIPGLVPGRKIVLRSDAFNGGYYIVEAEYVGSTWAQDWYANLIAKIY